MRFHSPLSKLLWCLGLALVACLPPSPEAWSHKFATEAVDCGRADNTQSPDAANIAAVFACIHNAIDQRRPFRAQTMVLPGSPQPGEIVTVPGRVVGIEVEDTYETFTFDGDGWRGPCLGLGLRPYVEYVGSACWASTPPSPSWIEYPNPDQLDLTNEDPARRFESARRFGRNFRFTVPDAHRGRVPWVP